MVNGSEPVLSLRLSVDYPGKPGVLRDVALQIQSGEILGLIGQSGSGKSTLALAILRLLGLKRGVARGELVFQGRNLMACSEPEMRGLRGRLMSLVLQSPLTSLNPALKIGTQLKEAYRAHASGRAPDWKTAVLAALESVSLPEAEGFLGRYPAQLSLGQAQRVLIAMAVLHRPALVIADEPTSALDTITASEILQLFDRLNRKLGMAILYISHDLLSVASLCDRIAILRAGELLECGETQQIFQNPSHAYTRQLIDALPQKPGTSAVQQVKPSPLDKEKTQARPGEPAQPLCKL